MKLRDDDKLRSKLVDYVQAAHAMEISVTMMLESMIKAADDPKTKEMLESHLQQTTEHKRRMEERLKALDSHRSVRKAGEAVAVAVPKGLIDRFRSDQRGKIARDGYVAEALEIAAYSLLEQLAMRCGDEPTAEAARRNLADEEEMAKKIAATWGNAIDRRARLGGLLSDYSATPIAA
jgi:ferritin-like metal-binding protein YciE